MCTVTIIPKGENDFIITSNRDEAPERVFLPPKFYTINNVKTLFPKDKLSGGSWIGVSDKNRVLCVLNGGFKFHERKSSYRLSRGIIVKELLTADNIVTSIDDFNFHGVEPFTLVIVDWNDQLTFKELVWDGNQKHLKELPLESKIWSSTTLYTKAMKDERTQWFENFKSENTLNAVSLWHFHKTAGSGNDDYGVIMDRDFVKTTSITQIEKTNDLVEMRYDGLNKSPISHIKFRIPQVVNE